MGWLQALAPSTKSKAPKVSKASADRIKNILGISQLEALPAHAAQAFQLASDPKSKLSDFVKIIESDEALSARVVRIANSVYFLRGTPATDIDKAVANIGLNELRCLLSATMLRNLLQGKSSLRKQVWANSVATAIFARGLSRYVQNISAGEAFLCGLVHDVGKLVMIRRAPDLYQQVLNLVSTTDLDFPAAEEKIYELDHVEVGAWVAQSWAFPESVIDAISRHHAPWPVDGRDLKEGKDLALVIKGADLMAHSAGIGFQSGFNSFKERSTEGARKFYSLIGISNADGESFIQLNKREFEQNVSLYEIES